MKPFLFKIEQTLEQKLILMVSAGVRGDNLPYLELLQYE